jgi:branched-chain amino acid transport system substrate-binding protein
MSNPPEQPTGTDGPLRYAPRRLHDDPKQWSPSATPSTKSAAAPKSGASHADAEPDGNQGFRDSPFPLHEMRFAPTPATPPPTRSRFAAVRDLAILTLVAIVSSSLVVLMYPLIFSRHPDTAVVNPPAPQVAVNPSAPQVVVNEPAPVRVDERASLPPPAAVATQRAPGPAVRGVTDTEIRFGIAAPFSGSARELGRQMKLGIDTAFNAVNAAGGVHGRQLKLIAADDGYEPTRTIPAMKQLLEKDQVFGIVGNVGTPTATVAMPFALEQRMLFFGAFTGAGILRRDPPDRYVFNYRASYAEETDAVVRYLVKVRRIRPEQIAVFAQQDSYGDAGFAGVARAVRALRGGIGGPAGAGDAAILRLNYKRNTVDVDEAVAALRLSKTPIKAVIMVPTYRAAARFIEKTRDLFPGMIYTNVSFVGSTALAQELMLLGPRFAEGVIVTQVVPPTDGYSSLVLEYKAALAKYAPGETPDYVSLEGYIGAGLLAEALKRTGPDLDTEKLVETLENLRQVDIGVGTPLSFGRTDHQGSHKVWGTQLDQAGHYQAIDLQ